MVVRFVVLREKKKEDAINSTISLGGSKEGSPSRLEPPLAIVDYKDYI